MCPPAGAHRAFASCACRGMSGLVSRVVLVAEPISPVCTRFVNTALAAGGCDWPGVFMNQFAPRQQSMFSAEPRVGSDVGGLPPTGVGELVGLATQSWRCRSRF